MLLLVIYSILNIIIARWLDKRMHFAMVCHTILFVISSLYLLFVWDNPYIINIFKKILSENNYNILVDVIKKKSILIQDFELTSIVIIELFMIILTFIILSFTCAFVVKKTIKAFKKSLKTFILNNLNIIKNKLFNIIMVIKIYLRHCKLNN